MGAQTASCVTLHHFRLSTLSCLLFRYTLWLHETNVTNDGHVSVRFDFCADAVRTANKQTNMDKDTTTAITIFTIVDTRAHVVTCVSHLALDIIPYTFIMKVRIRLHNHTYVHVST